MFAVEDLLLALAAAALMLLNRHSSFPCPRKIRIVFGENTELLAINEARIISADKASE